MNVTYSNAVSAVLSIRSISNYFEFSWPQSSHYLQLQSSTNLAFPWMAVTNTPALLQGIWSVLLPQISLSNQTFWRVSE